MILHLSNGKDRLVRIDAPTMGLAITGVTFEAHDFHDLLKLKDLHEYMGILYTRFTFTAPNKENT